MYFYVSIYNNFTCLLSPSLITLKGNQALGVNGNSEEMDACTRLKVVNLAEEFHQTIEPLGTNDQATWKVTMYHEGKNSEHQATTTSVIIFQLRHVVPIVERTHRTAAQWRPMIKTFNSQMCNEIVKISGSGLVASTEHIFELCISYLCWTCFR